jgi:ABC-2 type transport system permease protein/lipopolysaccharide transport system permease protein
MPAPRNRRADLSPVQVLEIDSQSGWGARLDKGLGDIAAGLKLRETWMFLGWQEVRKQYRRSVIGPFWITLNMGIMVGALGLLYSQLFHQDIVHFLPYLTVGFVVWNLLVGLVNESCSVFTSVAASLKQTKMPLSVYAYQLLWRQLVLFLHNFTIYVIVALIFGVWPGLNILMALPGLALILIAGFFVALIMGPLSARFRDVPPITASVTQIFFFITPVFWTTSSLPGRHAVILLNPFYHFLEIVRQPLLGQAPDLIDWTVSVAITIILALVGTLFFSRFRARIPYWA